MLNKRGVVPYPRWITPPDGSPRKIVNSPAEETAATGVAVDENGDPVGTPQGTTPPPPDATPVSAPPRVPYPKWIQAHEALDGVKKIVQNREDHEREIGKHVGEDGIVIVEQDFPPSPAAPVTAEQIAKLEQINRIAAPVSAPPPDAAQSTNKAAPPTLETVIAAGYKPDVAAKIVAEEQFKFNAGHPPYGTTPVVAVPPDAPPPPPDAVSMAVPEPVQPGQTEAQPEPAAQDGEPAKKTGDAW